jgi:hypothetical protein
MWQCSIYIHVTKGAGATRLGTLLKPAFVEQRLNKPLLYGDFGRVAVVATTEQAASGGFGRNRAKRKCLKSRFLGQILNTSISITKPLLFQLSYGGNIFTIKDLRHFR